MREGAWFRVVRDVRIGYKRHYRLYFAIWWCSCDLFAWFTSQMTHMFLLRNMHSMSDVVLPFYHLSVAVRHMILWRCARCYWGKQPSPYSFILYPSEGTVSDRTRAIIHFTHVLLPGQNSVVNLFYFYVCAKKRKF